MKRLATTAIKQASWSFSALDIPWVDLKMGCIIAGGTDWTGPSPPPAHSRTCNVSDLARSAADFPDSRPAEFHSLFPICADGV